MSLRHQQSDLAIEAVEYILKYHGFNDEDIKTYLSCEKYLDKAGAYGIQSSIGKFIKNINGCFFSVMGLPLNDVRELLQQVEHFIVNETN